MSDTKLNSKSEDLDVVIAAGKILMESGAEIYRIEDTMKHMADSLKIENFNAYVVNRGIIASGTNCKGDNEARVTAVPETTIQLDKIEAVNALSREVSCQPDASAKYIAQRLQNICEIQSPRLWSTLLAYFIGAGCFSYAIGSSIVDSLCSAIVGFMMGLILNWAGKYIKATVLLTILGSSIVTAAANLLFLLGIGEQRGLIILGALMLLVPGAVFTNAVREFSQNNHSTGLTLMMSALLNCLSISCGVALTTEILPFAEQMTSVFSYDVNSPYEIVTRTIMAGTGTVAFSFLFHAPRKYYLDLGLLGATSWMLYLICNMTIHVDMIVIFIPALFAAIASRVLSVRRKCPITIFLSTSIFPLIPGLSFYRSIYFLMTDNPEIAMDYMRSCFISAFAIALSIIIIQEIRIRPKKA